ncbi:MAG: ABC transporter ATP-binding protein [Gallionellaceae bacterium]|nr:ABC transporter ATP-binding protein [Gallionellaceae bacterium]MDD5365223.1 ABC transporter ATP-binding protein [Gallionellaceae bacterium]
MNVLETENITKTFQEGSESVEVLKGISLSVARGEVVALEGRSGSGKTTFLSIAGCILTPSGGRLAIAGQAMDMGNARELASARRRSIGFVFQQFNLFPALTARENVEFALNMKGRKDASARREAEAMLDRVGLADRREFLPRDLSGGQKQRVAIARALAGGPPLILADEPTANLDSHVGEQILGLFRELAKRDNRGLMIVTHDAKVRAIADRVAHIEDGRILTGDG